MALQPKSGPGLPCWGLLVQRPTPNLEDQVSVFMTPGDRVVQLYPQALGTHGLPCWGLLVQRPTPNLEDQVSAFMTPGDRVVQLYPQALGTHFSRLLRYAWVTVGLFFNPGQHTRVS
jgi:hypothetical protein